MHTDCSFYTGKTHEVCQDYARSGMIGEMPYAIVSDGCSGSPDTDFGSRLLTMAARYILETKTQLFFENNVRFGLATIIEAGKMAKAVGMPLECLDATLGVVIIDPSDGLAHVRMFGDGGFTIHASHKDYNWFTFNERRWQSGMPFYLSYLLDEKRFAEWTRINGEQGAQLRKVTIDDTGKVDPDDLKWFDAKEDDLTLSAPVSYDTRKPFLSVQGEDVNVHLLSVFTDGASSFVNIDENKVASSEPIENVVKGLFSFKNFKGKYVQRRINRYMKDCVKNGIYHEDDVSVASIFIKEYEK